MKLILAIVQDKDSNNLSAKFIDNNIRATKLSTTGGFLKAGNTTFIVGIEDERVQEVLDLIKQTSHSRSEFMTPPASINYSADASMPYPIEVQVGGATVFVLPIEEFMRF